MKKSFVIFMSALMISSNFKPVFADEKKDNLPEISKSLEIINSKKNKIPKYNVQKNNNIKVIIDENMLDDINSLVYQDRVYLPLRTLSENLGFSVDYIPENKIVIIDSGRIQLPINQNKAVVDNKIVSIDNSNNNIGTIVLEDVTYLPLRFISENLGYKVSYEPNKKIVNIESKQQKVEQLNPQEAQKIYKEIIDINNEIKSKTLETEANSITTLNSIEDKIKTKSTIKSMVELENDKDFKIYLKQDINAETLGQKEKLQQTGFYKDGYFYLNQGENKFKIKYNLEDINSLSQYDDDFNIVKSGTVKDLGNNKKQYSFDVDVSKTIDLAEELSDKFDLQDEKLDILKYLQIKQSTIKLIVDSNNIILEEVAEVDLNIKYKDFEIENQTYSKTKIKNINKTKVEIPDEDTSEYKELSVIDSIE